MENPKHVSRRDFIRYASVEAGGMLAIPDVISAMMDPDQVRNDEREISTSPSPSPSRKIGPFSVFPVGLGCMNAAWEYGEARRVLDFPVQQPSCKRGR